MKFKKFQKTKEEMTAVAFAERMGFNRDNFDSENVLVYLGAIAIEIHPVEVVGEMPHNLYVVYANDDFESSNLGDAEKALYDSLVKDKTIQVKKKKEKVDPKMPLGLDSYLDSFYQISSFIGFQSDRYIRGVMVLKANDSVRTLTEEMTSYEVGNKIKELTTSFEKIVFELENSNTNYSHVEEIDKFLSDKFPTENKSIEVIYSMSYTEYEVSSYMGSNRNTPLFESLDGADGQHTKAIELAKEFDLKFKDADWGRGDIGSFYEEIDEFLKETFYPKKKYTITASVTTYCTAEISATSQEEADDIANGMDGEEFFNSESGGEFEIKSVKKK